MELCKTHRVIAVGTAVVRNRSYFRSAKLYSIETGKSYSAWKIFLEIEVKLIAIKDKNQIDIW